MDVLLWSPNYICLVVVGTGRINANICHLSNPTRILQVLKFVPRPRVSGFAGRGVYSTDSAGRVGYYMHSFFVFFFFIGLGWPVGHTGLFFLVFLSSESERERTDVKIWKNNSLCFSVSSQIERDSEREKPGRLDVDEVGWPVLRDCRLEPWTGGGAAQL